MARARRTREERERRDLPRFELPEPELIVVARPEAGLRAAPEGVTAKAADAGALEDRLGAEATLRPLFGTSEERLRYEASVSAATAETPPPDLSVFYRVEAPAGDLERLAGELGEHEAIEAAYVKPPAEPAQGLNDMAPREEAPPHHTPDFSTRQGYLDAAPGGIDARYAWTIPGGRGTGVRIIDIEGAWRFTHEDLLRNQGGAIGGTQSADLGWRNHGTAVVGEFGGDVNAFGVTGICPEANVRAISIFGPGQGSAAAIRQAANALTAGDVILIELHRPGPRFNFASRADQRGYIAVEWWEDDFAAIRFAIGRGVIVVEAAGNGAENLDDPLYSTRPAAFPAAWTNPFNRANRDSGAIVVGAGAPPPGTHGRNHGPDRSRLDFSNWGSIVDAQGWGREVTTTGYGDLQGGANEDEWYTDQFSGTSSASPIVVGAIASLQGVQRRRGAPLTAAAVRNLLRMTGSPQQDAPTRPATQRIGNRPNLRQLIGRIEKKEKIEVKELHKEQLKLEKAERKELKDRKQEKLEKVERKELKDRKQEKLEKAEAKELKDRKQEKLETKELKEGQKELKDRKPELEKLTDKRLQEGKLREKLEEIRGIRIPETGLGPEPGLEAAEHRSLEERIQYLESAIQELTHFIAPELRPDLSEGALADEADLYALGDELELEAGDAKQAKDAKDIEKLSEY